MSKQFKVPLNLAKLATDPVSASIGDIYFNTTGSKIRLYTSTGWTVKPGAIDTIASRAPTHEPYAYHNQGVQVAIELEPGQTTPPPDAPTMPDNWSITKE